MKRKLWTIMVYLAGDNDLDEAGLDDLKEMKKIGTTEQVNVVAQFDRQGPKLQTRRYFVGKRRLWTKAQLGETDTGSPAMLIDFARWAIDNYPAQHYMLVIWNHGNGWDDRDIYRAARTHLGPSSVRLAKNAGDGIQRDSVSIRRVRVVRVKFQRALFRSTIRHALGTRGIAYDETSKDFLDNTELQKVLAKIHKKLRRKLDVLGMDACLMSMVEIGYQLREHVALSVASEEMEPDYGWPYDDILDELKKNPQMSPRALASQIVRCYGDSWDSKSGVTQSACDLSKSEDLAKAIDELAVALKAEIVHPAVRGAVLIARAQVQSYYRPEYVDLYDLCGLIADHCSSRKIHGVCLKVQRAVKNGRYVVANCSRGSKVKNSHGVSIYFPEPAQCVSGRISALYHNLDFAQKSRWPEFVAAWLKSLERPA